MQLNRRLSVWQKPKDFYQILSFLWKGHNKRLRGQAINKTVTNQNHTEPKRTKTVIWNRALFWQKRRVTSFQFFKSITVAPLKWFCKAMHVILLDKTYLPNFEKYCLYQTEVDKTLSVKLRNTCNTACSVFILIPFTCFVVHFNKVY